MMINQLPENIETNENNTIDNSVYSKSLNRLLELCNHYSKNLENKIKDLKGKSGNYPLIPILVFFISLILLIILISAMDNSIIATLIPTGFFITSIPIAIIGAIKNKQKLKSTNSQLNTIETIKNYLKSELKISREYKNYLSNSQILNKENMHQQQIDSILSNKTSLLSFLNDKYLEEYRDKYLEEYRKNLIIIDSLKDLDDKQKEDYLKKIYSQIGNDLITKMNININDNDELASINNNSQKMLTTNANNNSFNESLQKQDETSNTIQKGISLSKDNYTINNSNELNGIFKYQHLDDDILPPRAQEELENGHQFSKKFPK